jgi:hypothetical protein
VGAEAILEGAVRDAGDRIRAALAIRFRDLDMAEEAFAFASLRAVETWSRDGPPRDPAAWLYAVGRRRAFDLGRRAKVRGAAVHDASEPTPDPETILMVALEAATDLHLLPPGPGARGADRADAAHALRPFRRAHCAGLADQRGRHAAAADPGQAQDPRRAHPL